jgi:hypothetical protein
MVHRIDKSGLPQSTWSIDQLKTWLLATCSKWALDAYWMGTALIYAERELKDQGKWMEFCREACPGLSYETLRRYIRLAKAVKAPDKLYGIRLNQAYELTGIVQPKKAEQPHTTPDQPHATPDKPPTTGSGSRQPPKNDPPVVGGVDDPDDAAPGPNVQGRHLRPAATLDFFAAKVVEQLHALQQLPKQERCQGLDVERLRNSLEALKDLVENVLHDLPKHRRKAG